MGSDHNIRIAERLGSTVIAALVTALILSAAVSGCKMDPGGNNTPRTVSWTGAWENDTEYYGTFALEMTLEGEYLDQVIGSGTITGTMVCTGFDGTVYFDGAVDGSWENDRASGLYDALDFSLSSSDDRITMDGYIYYDFAADITDETWEMGSFDLDGNNGLWHTNPDSFDINLLCEDGMDIDAIVTIDTTFSILDIAYVGTSGAELYATVLDADGSRLVSMDISNGSLTELVSTCPEPRGVAYDGTYLWVVGADAASNRSLYKYNLATISTNESGYPVAHTDLANADAITWNGSTLHTHNGSILTSSIGEIDTATGAIAAVLYASFGSLPDLARTTKLAQTSRGYHTTYFAPGDVWCEYRILDTDGNQVESWYGPTNSTGPVAVEGPYHYLIQGTSQKLYVLNDGS